MKIRREIRHISRKTKEIFYHISDIKKDTNPANFSLRRLETKDFHVSAEYVIRNVGKFELIPV